MAIIRAQSEIADASTKDLVETYNALSGKSIKKFSSRAAGESQVANAIMAAQDRAGHAGVPKGAQPVAMTLAEIKTMADELPITQPPSGPALIPTASGGNSKLQSASLRRQAMDFIAAEHARTRAPVPVADVVAKFGAPAKGLIFKLMAHHWVEAA